MLIFSKASRHLTAIFVLTLFVVGCKHGVSIVGQGTVSSASGTRDCSASQSECRFDVKDAYQETFTAQAASGWIFDAWERCQIPAGNQCKFNVAKDIVADYIDESVPSVVARFRRPIAPLFRNNSNNAVVPDTPAGRQLTWLVGQIASSSTSTSDIQARFDPEFIGSTSLAAIQESIDSVRNYLSNAVIFDVVSATPVFMRVIIADPDDPQKKGAFITLNTRYEGSGMITGLQVSFPFFTDGSNTGAAEKSKNLNQLGNTFAGLAQNTGMLVAKIENDKCRPLLNRLGARAQPTGSIFKIWSLGALAQELTAGRISSSTMIPLSADNSVPAGSQIATTPFGTQFSISDMAALMMGISDNTATDHIHELIGRDRLENILKRFKHKNSTLMMPFLKVNEQFNIYWSIPPAQARDYATGSEEFQRSFVTNTLQAMPPAVAFPYANEKELLQSSWAASPNDVCSAYAGLRKFDNRSIAFQVMDQAIGAEAGGLVGVRNRWDRVWSKGGSLANADGNYVYTYSILFESDDKGAYVVVMMANNSDGSPIDSAPVFSIASRVEEILFDRP